MKIDFVQLVEIYLIGKKDMKIQWKTTPEGDEYLEVDEKVMGRVTALGSNSRYGSKYTYSWSGNITNDHEVSLAAFLDRDGWHGPARSIEEARQSVISYLEEYGVL